MIELQHYRMRNGRDPFGEWLSGLRDINTRAKVEVRLGRLERGLFGDCEPIGDGLSELRIDWGPGYRVYFWREGKTLILLLCGGDKGKQAKDIVMQKATGKTTKRAAVKRHTATDAVSHREHRCEWLAY